MRTNNNDTKKTEAKKQAKTTRQSKKFVNPFRMDISDEIYDPFDDVFGFDRLENRMFRNFRNVFTDFGLLSEFPKKEEKMEVEKEEKKPEKVEEVKPKEEEPKEEQKEEEKEEEINTEVKAPKEEKNEKMEEEKETEPKEEKKTNEGTFYSKVYYRSYNNLNGQPNEESYQSQTIKQMNDGHKISETKEAYKNSDGVEKSAYQRGLDDKTTRFIKERNTKTGKKDQHKVIKGIEESEIKDFNKEYNEFSKKCGFRKNFHGLDMFKPFGCNRKLLASANPSLFLHRLLF